LFDDFCLSPFHPRELESRLRHMFFTEIRGTRESLVEYSGLIRVPIAKRNSDSATRIEYRSPDPACNPYLAFSVILAAGLRGIQEGYELPVEADANLFEMDNDVLEKMSIHQLPQSLNEALHVMENSSLVADALGDHIFEWFLRNKRAEWRTYKTHISQYELGRYLRSL